LAVYSQSIIMRKVFYLLIVLSTLPSFGQTTKEEFVQLGLKQHSNKNYDEAILLYDKALALDSSYFTAYVNRGNSYFEKENYTNALSDANKAMTIDPENAVPYNNRGLIYKFQGKYDEAILEYNKAITLNKIYYEAYINKVRAQLKTAKPQDAKITVDNLKKEFPTVPDSYIVAFIYYAIQYDVENALKELDIAVSLDKMDETALDHRARYKDEIEDNKGAIIDFNKLIAMNPGKPDYYYGRSSANYDLKNYDAVISDCNKTIAIDNNFYSAYSMLGDVYDTYGDANKSVANYEKAISIRPSEEYAYNELGKVYYVKKDYINALSVFSRILEKNPNIISSLEYRADCNLKLLNYNTSIEDYTKLISLNPEKLENYMNRANVELAAGKKTDACTDMKKGIKMVKKGLSEEYLYAHTFLYKNCRETINPKLLKVNDLYDQAYDLYVDGKKDLAIKKYDEMIKIVPDSASLYFNRGKFKRELDQHENAITDYKKAVQLDKKNVESWTAMGISYHYLKQYDNATKSYLEAIKADSSYAMAYNNLAQIYRERKENDKALQYLELAVQKDPNYIKAYFSLGEVYAEIGNKEKACYNFKRAEALGESKARIKIISECE
jgi:tetratricopeptide (TPR) repeat protein